MWVTGVTLCWSGSWLEAVSAPSQGDSESQCLTGLAGDPVFNKHLMLRLSFARLCCSICYHGTAPAQGEMPALRGHKCQGEISLGSRSQFCRGIPALCRNCPLQSCVMQELGSSPFAAACFPLSYLLLNPGLAPAEQTGPHLASVNDSLCFKNQPRMLWLIMISHPVSSLYITLFLSLHDHCPFS